MIPVAVVFHRDYTGRIGAEYSDPRWIAPALQGKIEGGVYLMGGMVDGFGVWAYHGQETTPGLILHDLVDHGVAGTVVDTAIDRITGLLLREFIWSDWEHLSGLGAAPEWADLDARLERVAGIVGDRDALNRLVLACADLPGAKGAGEVAFFWKKLDTEEMGRRLLGWCLTVLEALDATHGTAGRVACLNTFHRGRARLESLLFGAVVDGHRQPSEALSILNIDADQPFEALIRFNIRNWRLVASLAIHREGQ